MKLQRNLRFLLLVGVFFPTVIYSQWVNVAPTLLGGYSSDYGAALMYRNGVCWAGYHTLFKSLDSGKTWQDANLDLGYDFATNIYFSDENNGIVSSLDNGIFVTTDQGQNWSNVLIISACFGATLGSTPNHMVACNRDGSGGNVYISHDSGKTWRKLSLEVYYGTVYEVTFHPATGNILALSRSITPRKSHIFVSTDNGDNWRQQSGQVDLDCYSFSFHECKQNIIYIANEDHNEQPDGYSQIYVSSDYGNTFSSLYSSPSPSLAGAATTSRDAAFIPRSNAGSVLRSIDSGRTWQSIGGPSVKEDCRSICAIDENIILAADRQGNIWRTINSGGYPLVVKPIPTTKFNFELSSKDITVDSVGAEIKVPIIIKRTMNLPAFDFLLHYNASDLTYEGSSLTTGKSIDDALSSKPGRAVLHITSTDVSATGDTLIGYSYFIVKTFTGDSCETKIKYDSAALPTVSNYCINIIYSINDSAISHITMSPDAMTPATITLSAARIISDSIGAIIWMPIKMKRSKAVPAFDMVIHYEDGPLVYKQSVTLGLKSVDIPGEQWPGRAKIYFEPADLSPITDSVIGYAKFAFYPYEIQCSNLWYDSLQFKNMSPCEGLPVGIDTAHGIIGSYEGCGQSVGSVEEHSTPAVKISLQPNPAMGMVSIISDKEISVASIKLINTLGSTVIALQGSIGADPFEIPIESLANGMYYIQIDAPDIHRVIPLAHIR